MADLAICMDWRLRERRSRRRKRGWQTSGGVVLDVQSGRLLLVRTRREAKEGRNGWTWPKGLIDPGEGPLFAAIREISEEAGALAEPVAAIAVLETRRALRHYFLLHLIRGGLPLGRETLEVCWVEPREAKALLERKRDRRVLRAAREAIRRMRARQKAGHGANFATKPSRSPALTAVPVSLPKSTLFSK